MFGQVLAAVLLLVAVGGVGTPGAAYLGTRLSLPVATRAGLAPLVGLTFVGVVTLLVGHLHLLGPWLPWALALAGVVTLLAARRAARELARAMLAGTRAQTRRYPVPIVAVGVGLVLAGLAALAPPNRIDEVEYHWPAPLAWVEAGGWNDSPFKHVDAFPFMEVVYTSAATQGSYVAAHVMHLLTLVAVGLAAAGAARPLGVSGTGPVAAGAMAVPVVWDGAYAAYNDTAVGAFGAAAVAVVLGAKGRPLAGVGTAAGLLAVGMSIKPTAVAAAGAVGLVLLLQRTAGPAHRNLTLKGLGTAWLLIGASAASTLAFWSVRRWVYTGSLTDVALSGTPSADVLSRLPTDAQQLIAPVMPFVTGVIGAQEPWGGRTSTVMQVFLVPAVVYVLWRRGRVLRNFAVVAVPAFAHWVVLGLQIVRTRFHIVAWALLVASLRVVVEDAQGRYPRARGWLEAVWAACVVLGVVDVSFEMVRVIRTL